MLALVSRTKSGVLQRFIDLKSFGFAQLLGKNEKKRNENSNVREYAPCI